MITEQAPFRLGIESPKRCTNASTVVIRIKKPRNASERGSMGLCDHCLGKFMEQHASEDHTVTRIETVKVTKTVRREVKRAKVKVKKKR